MITGSFVGYTGRNKGSEYVYVQRSMTGVPENNPFRAGKDDAIGKFFAKWSINSTAACIKIISSA
jgi:hypothetical protein